MRTLRYRDRGQDVKELQQRLLQLGFNPGTPDGVFGWNTNTAVIQFQRRRGLVADGIVGPASLRALGLLAEEDFSGGPSVMNKITVDIVMSMFPGTPRANIETHLPFVLKALEKVELVDKPMALMALATIRAETGSFLPIDEGISQFNTRPPGPPFNLYDLRTDLGNMGAPDGANFKGRGFIQLTGRDNYRRYGQIIGLGDRLVENPDLANSPQIAAQLLASFLKDKEKKIREALQENKLDAARRLVNGGTHGLAHFEKAYKTGAQLI